MNILHNAYVALVSGLTACNPNNLKEILWKDHIGVNVSIRVINLEDRTYRIKYDNGDKEWYKDDKLHREDGPAIELADGGSEWYLNGQLHREDGPAIEYADGNKTWYLNDKLYPEEEYEKELGKLKCQS
jgi:hypothetical protein